MGDICIPGSRQQWIVSTCALAFGCFLLLQGRMADIYGKCKIFVLWSGWVAVTDTLLGECHMPRLFALAGLTFETSNSAIQQPSPPENAISPLFGMPRSYQKCRELPLTRDLRPRGDATRRTLDTLGPSPDVGAKSKVPRHQHAKQGCAERRQVQHLAALDVAEPLFARRADIRQGLRDEVSGEEAVGGR